ncbi:DUF6507 family protein [Streptomyces xanthochromogenes]|uniref:DUF6507 family protein n=1 Tax=Streptomyces xanthochromogenes TaxID=67384 RepID=UPI0034360A3C
MTGWDIDPAGVGSVLSRVWESERGLNEGISLYGKGVEGAVLSVGTLDFGGGAGQDSGQAGLVAVALSEFMQGTETDVVFMPLRTGNSINGAVEATNCYVRGALEQATNAQRQAELVPDVAAVLEAARKKGTGE